jgi:hypothetical protein
MINNRVVIDEPKITRSIQGSQSSDQIRPDDWSRFPEVIGIYQSLNLLSSSLLSSRFLLYRLPTSELIDRRQQLKITLQKTLVVPEHIVVIFQLDLKSP